MNDMPGCYRSMLESFEEGEFAVCLPIMRGDKSDVIIMASEEAMSAFDDQDEMDPFSDEPWQRAAHAILFAWECRRRMDNKEISC
jgi:hypothetical protein